MKHFSKFLGVLCAFCLMIIFLITSVEAVVYWTPGYFEQEYSRYQVAEAVQMEMNDLLEVTDEMMDYLRGDREDLHVLTVVNGEEREFFNEREIAHMEDVQGLFLKALALRRSCLLIAVGCILILCTKYRSSVRTLLPRALCAGTGLFFLLTALLAGIISTNFTKYFIIFHKIFFSNDLWILDPRTDLLINIVPEPFFVDTAARIAITFGMMTLCLFAICVFFIRREKHCGLLLALLLCMNSFSLEAQADTSWPSGVSLESDAGIVMDAATGTVLYGKNIHETYSPASITKVLTALIVLEHCSLDEMVTFSQNAVYNVESNSSSAGYDTGDTATVKDCLYALLLKSANESANALAEHVSGSTESFAELMNQKAAELGCADSHFANPSGLNDENHYVSAYDMALITRAAFTNETFAKIVATTYYELPPNKQNPEGQGISPGNKLVKKNWPEYYRPEVLGGKTGYTSIALNTLVNGAKKGDTTLITVILHSQGTQYTDTHRLLDFGFGYFQSVKISDYDETFSSIGSDLTLAGLTASGEPTLSLHPNSWIILPKHADPSELSYSMEYTIPEQAPEHTLACVNYQLGERFVGQAYLTLSSPQDESEFSLPKELIEGNLPSLAANDPDLNTEDENSSDSDVSPLSDTKKTGDDKHDLFHISFHLPSLFWKILLSILILGGGGSAAVLSYRKKKQAEEAALLERRRRRAERLRETGVSEAEFDLMMQSRRENKRNSSKSQER